MSQTDFHKQETAMNELFTALDAILKLHGSATDHEFGETGMLISSRGAASCLTGTARTLCYWHSLLVAIEKLQTDRHEPLRMLYPGSGPFATLILPLLLGKVTGRIEIHLIEINNQSLASLANFLNLIQRPNVKCHIHHCDILEFDSTALFDLMISEVMLSSLQTEGQVAITYHLSQFLAPHAILIPEAINVDLCWSDVTKEFSFVDSHRKPGRGLSLKQLSPFRKTLTPLIRLDKNVRQRYKREGEYLLLQRVEFKKKWPDTGAVICTTNIQFIDDIRLDEYQNGLTSPIVMADPGCVSGVPLEIKFRMLKMPGYKFVPIDAKSD
ncbi:hypothetical protein MACH26_34220 [Planctobacterium marinum]|uniref:Phytanoyl-CoA dioxygenase n=1 Tax=Planctobacterium marinum TaxID=1631968 RepID=A0AA48HN85_9ALTE|nr:hypothetical protein MACH26_34220 [Planctobacterium marinum]